MNMNEHIRSLRKERQMTQEELAEAMGVSCASVSKWEKGQCAPDLSTLAELADFFQVSVDALLGHRVDADRLEDLLTEMDQAADSRQDEKAYALCQAILRHYPNDAAAVERCANACYRLFVYCTREEYMQTCIQQTRRLFTLKRGEPEGDRLGRMRDLANQYELLDQWETAMDCYEKANAGDSENNHIARCLHHLGRSKEALPVMSDFIRDRIFELSLDMDVIIRIWEEQGDYARACAAQEWIIGVMESAAFDPSARLTPYLRLASLRHWSGDLDAAGDAVCQAARLAAQVGTRQSIAAAAPFFQEGKPRKLLTNRPDAGPFVRLVAESMGADFAAMVDRILGEA